MDELDRAVEAIEQGDAWLDTDEVVDIDVRQPLDKVIPVRLSADKWAAVRREARHLGMGPSTLLRMWALEKLREVAAARRPA